MTKKNLMVGVSDMKVISSLKRKDTNTNLIFRGLGKGVGRNQVRPLWHLIGTLCLIQCCSFLFVNFTSCGAVYVKQTASLHQRGIENPSGPPEICRDLSESRGACWTGSLTYV